MKTLAITLLAAGLLGLYGFFQGAIKGEIKWEANKSLTGAQARMVGMASLAIGLVLLAAGGFLAYRVLLR